MLQVINSIMGVDGWQKCETQKRKKHLQNKPRHFNSEAKKKIQEAQRQMHELRSL